MDPTLYKAAMEGNTGDNDFILSDHLKMDEEKGYQVTPAGNTVLHVAAFYGHSNFVREVLKISPGLLCCKNNKNETALHIAANESHGEVAVALLDVQEGDKITSLMRMIDANGDTALHKAVGRGSFGIVSKLVREDPEFEFPANKAGETPLYLAAESGFVECLDEILRYCKKPTFGGPCHRTPLQAAILQERDECIKSLWEWNKSLCEEPDKWGWNSLHYAVKLGLDKVVSDMFGWKKSLAYIRAGSEDDWTTAFHIAASEGDINMINQLSEHCPDYWEMFNSSGQNVLHVAILNHQEKVVDYFLNSEKCRNLISVPDNDGNTPLHLVAATWDHVPEELINRSIEKKILLFNKKNQTPVDIALLSTWTTEKKEKLVDDLCTAGPLGRRDINVKRKYTYVSEIKDEMETNGTIQQKGDDQEKAKEYERNIESYMSAAQIHLVVATLLMTVTFAAGFTLPGGFDSDDGPHKGMAILTRKAAFRAFVVADAIAFTCSAGAIFTYFTMADYSVTDDHEMKLATVSKLYLIAMNFQILSMGAVVIAFVTGMYATLAHSVGLAVTVCVIGCISFPIYCWVLGVIVKEFWNST